MQTVRRNLGAQGMMAAILIIGLYFGYSFAREVVQAESLSRQEASSLAINAQISEENHKLERDLQYYNSPEYAELRARTDLNMRRPDELVILPVMPKDEQTQIQAMQPDLMPDSPAAGVTPVVSGTTAAATGAPQRNWDRWLSLFTTGSR